MFLHFRTAFMHDSVIRYGQTNIVNLVSSFSGLVSDRAQGNKAKNYGKKMLGGCFRNVKCKTYLAVSVVIFIFRWVRVWKFNIAMLSKEWFVYFRKRQPVLQVAR